jgi:hypothetical protein
MARRRLRRMNLYYLHIKRTEGRRPEASVMRRLAIAAIAAGFVAGALAKEQAPAPAPDPGRDPVPAPPAASAPAPQ